MYRNRLIPYNFLRSVICVIALTLFVAFRVEPVGAQAASDTENEDSTGSGQLVWTPMEPIPDELGLAGPFAGIHNGWLMVAGGANFPRPVWESDKVWHDAVYLRNLNADESATPWTEAGQLPRPVGYGSSIPIPQGILCLGGNDASEHFNSVWLIRIHVDDAAGGSPSIEVIDLPSLPEPVAYSTAGLIGNKVYVTCGQPDASLSSATSNLWSLDIGGLEPDDPQSVARLTWEVGPSFPGQARAFAVGAVQHDGYDTCFYVMSGRAEVDCEIQFLTDGWKFNPRQGTWSAISDAPRCFMAGTAFPAGQSHLVVSGGDDGRNFFRTDELKDAHPGFPRSALAYHCITDTWTDAGGIPANHVTTTAIPWKGSFIIPTGEVRPRVRSPQVYRIDVVPRSVSFGALNLSVIAVYLVVTTLLGFWFARRNKSTDDFFRGGQKVAWWAAGCSVFATMLSSLTYTGIPAKAYAQDWVYAVGNLMIPVVAVYAVLVALPFFRKLNVVTAYEYLEHRFNGTVRRVASGVFIGFHLFRMAIVMSLTGLALAVATPLTPAQSVILMGVLCILYSAAGGIEAVIWTDTLQSVVLLLGAFAALGVLITGIDGGWQGFHQTGLDHGKFSMANFHWDASDARLAFWVVVLGAIGQNLSSYTSDQAVVQRYMTTPTPQLAARSIWLNAGLSILATVLFFGIGSALFVYFDQAPEKLDMSLKTDQIFPYFIVSQMPGGLAGLIVAGIFAAAQSTVSTSMNSMTTAIFTDFRKPDSVHAEGSGLWAARILTLILGVTGTIIALYFLSPDIKSLFDSFIRVIGLFMGALGGLFLLGMLSRRASSAGALTGVVTAVVFLVWIWKSTSLQSYLYPFAGVVCCAVVGWLASLVMPEHPARKMLQ